MNNEYRVYIYAFLSRIMSDTLDKRFVQDLRANKELLELIGEETTAWMAQNDDETILDALNTDFSSMFIINTQPVESFILDAKNETLVGLQNPAMNFYYRHGFDVNMDQTAIIAPDHLSIEFAFMQTLIYRNEQEPQKEFLQEHLSKWVIPYMLGMESMASTPFYKEICSFIVEFLTSEYDLLFGEYDGK